MRWTKVHYPMKAEAATVYETDSATAQQGPPKCGTREARGLMSDRMLFMTGALVIVGVALLLLRPLL